MFLKYAKDKHTIDTYISQINPFHIALQMCKEEESLLLWKARDILTTYSMYCISHTTIFFTRGFNRTVY